MIVIAHVSDTHFDGGSRATERARRVMAHLESLPGPLDAILVSGDIADHGLTPEYELARAHLVSSKVPVLTLPGNHDARGNFRSVLLGEPAGEEPVNRVAEVGGVVFALADSSIPGRADGLLGEPTLAWLESVLSAGAPTVVCFHHPPVEVHEPTIDAIRLGDADRLADVLARHDNALAVLCGHAHTGAAATFAGRPVRVAPGVVSTLRLPWESDQVMDRDLPPAIAYHVLTGDGRLTTHYRVVP
ncbi:metallophosphoesterase [Saccharothrix obliqua]|uniref:metallophosphoesterase n=1 Tax=Saccharothrix obliqua TaxID=2861747 RepID=UPI001C5DC23E|nr:metallophosphoesterase [Saccharothrix obliqua]MBW4718216.1 metallophosphoesterase [Saccharothrix obliqua]